MNYVELIQALESAWRNIQLYNVEVPDTVIVVASGGRMAQTLLGHFAKETWLTEGQTIHEVLVVAEHLDRPASDIMTTLLHEATHGLAYSRKIKDTSGRRHNRRFALLAAELGLQAPIQPDSRLGYSECIMPADTANKYIDSINIINDALKLARPLKLKAKLVNKTSWSAECGCGVKIRVGKKVWAAGDGQLAINCMECDNPFFKEPDDD